MDVFERAVEPDDVQLAIANSFQTLETDAKGRSLIEQVIANSLVETQTFRRRVEYFTEDRKHDPVSDSVPNVVTLPVVVPVRQAGQPRYNATRLRKKADANVRRALASRKRRRGLNKGLIGSARRMGIGFTS